MCMTFELRKTDSDRKFFFSDLESSNVPILCRIMVKNV